MNWEKVAELGNDRPKRATASSANGAAAVISGSFVPAHELEQLGSRCGEEVEDLAELDRGEASAFVWGVAKNLEELPLPGRAGGRHDDGKSAIFLALHKRKEVTGASVRRAFVVEPPLGRPPGVSATAVVPAEAVALPEMVSVVSKEHPFNVGGCEGRQRECRAIP